MFPVASGLFPRSSKRIITAGLRPTSNTTYHHHYHQRTTFWICRTASKYHTLDTRLLDIDGARTS
jgi:hypothetical protein